tara:strand:- start:193 stop:354 length:162 start_codon:yes stop_codon:yes gene_type:complete
MSDEAYDKAVEASKDKAIDLLTSLGYADAESFDIMVDRLTEKILKEQLARVEE